MDLLISFDDTGSMAAVRKQVRQKLGEFIAEMVNAVSDIRIGVIIHNDYCDRDLIQSLNFTYSMDEVERFIHRSSSCGGGDHREAYAYVLNHMKGFSWREGVPKIAILIGDAPPHEKGSLSAGHRELYDWRQEVGDLTHMGVNVYPVQALNRGRIETEFYQGIANIAKTVRLDLTQFHHITQYITAIVHKESGTIEEYQQSRVEFSTNLSLRNMFAALTGKTVDKEFSTKIASLGKFQVSDVYITETIKNYVQEMGISYIAGKGYYQLTKPEKLQERKEVFFVDKETGETIMDTRWCREQLGVPLGAKGTVRPGRLTVKYDIFIQSTSYTRKLMPGTKFLYEVELK